ncbi:MAG TPA: pirin family protein [Rhabdaerophilum sp.]|nr:pirin family protein [Rhabdaerophilum sp.]
MSHLPGDDPEPGDAHGCDAIEQMILARASEIGGFEVRRALPSVGRKMIGPFIFFDQMGPSEFLLGQGLDVSPHPHIGLATVTYLFDGAIMHRDSLGVVQEITPGALNLMTAGRGVVHSERTGPEARHAANRRLFGIQLWAALPASREEQVPDFVHHEERALPRIVAEGKRVRLIMGAAYGEQSPVEFPHAALYAEAILSPGSILPLDNDYEERAVFIVSGEIDIAGDSFGPGRLLVFRPGDRISILGLTNARLMILGGDPMAERRHIWWNFVSSRKERIDQAKADWAAGRFDSVPGEAEFIPLP